MAGGEGPVWPDNADIQRGGEQVQPDLADQRGRPVVVAGLAGEQHLQVRPAHRPHLHPVTGQPPALLQSGIQYCMGKVQTGDLMVG